MSQFKYRHTFRQNREYSKEYYNNLCERFTEIYLNDLKARNGWNDLQGIDFGKQDMRGSHSISVFNARHCISCQTHFATMPEMRAFMQGYIASHDLKGA